MDLWGIVHTGDGTWACPWEIRRSSWVQQWRTALWAVGRVWVKSKQKQQAWCIRENVKRPAWPERRGMEVADSCQEKLDGKNIMKALKGTEWICAWTIHSYSLYPFLGAESFAVTRELSPWKLGWHVEKKMSYKVGKCWLWFIYDLSQVI